MSHNVISYLSRRIPRTVAKLRMCIHLALHYVWQKDISYCLGPSHVFPLFATQKAYKMVSGWTYFDGVGVVMVPQFSLDNSM